jgi:hypothetical protein
MSRTICQFLTILVGYEVIQLLSPGGPCPLKLLFYATMVAKAGLQIPVEVKGV